MNQTAGPDLSSGEVTLIVVGTLCLVVLCVGIIMVGWERQRGIVLL
jgi:hypothetical protein